MINFGTSQVNDVDRRRLRLASRLIVDNGRQVLKLVLPIPTIPFQLQLLTSSFVRLIYLFSIYIFIRKVACVLFVFVVIWIEVIIKKKSY